MRTVLERTEPRISQYSQQKQRLTTYAALAQEVHSWRLELKRLTVAIRRWLRQL